MLVVEQVAQISVAGGTAGQRIQLSLGAGFAVAGDHHAVNTVVADCTIYI